MPPRSGAIALVSILAACADASVPAGTPSVTLTPPWIAVVNGDSAQLSAVAVGPQGDTVTAPTLIWSSANPSVAEVDGNGLVHGRALGSARVRVSYQGVSDSSDVVVTPPVLVGAGDIADCTITADSATATLLDTLQGVVFTAGDNAYPNGTIGEYMACYDPTWGRHKSRTRPSPGNHEYNSGGIGYYQYFGALAGDPGVGYYSYDFAGWHIISLNSSVAMIAGSAQEQWLRTDLSLHPASCSLAYWHHPRFSSGTTHGNYLPSQAVWQALYDLGADVVISGHEHHYERFAPQRPDSAPDPTNGIRQFVVGTGGRSLYPFGPAKANSEVRNNTTRGVLKLTLRPNGYDWEFVPIAGGTFRDSGSGTCH